MKNLEIMNLVKDHLGSMPERTPEESERIKKDKEFFLNDLSTLVLIYSMENRSLSESDEMRKILGVKIKTNVL